MAKSKDTYSKREKEQKRSRYKQEKKVKMEERKANKKKGGTLEEMMAYLDENGNLTDVPQDPRSKKVFKQDDIQIGVPKQEYADGVPRNGVVAFYNKPKGFGFITDIQTNERIFFHANEMQEPLEESDKVSFFVERGPRGWSALQVAKIR